MPYVYFANELREFVGVWHQSDELTTFRIRTQETAPLRQVYQLNSLGPKYRTKVEWPVETHLSEYRDSER